ncbi:hypothetical protein AL036_14725 [Salipiger aestuarii]|nr:hypothetical protein AL036_14725 [Salipiger aestuarii]
MGGLDHAPDIGRDFTDYFVRILSRILYLRAPIFERSIMRFMQQCRCRYRNRQAFGFRLVMLGLFQRHPMKRLP